MTRDIKKSPALTELRAASPSGLPLEAVITANNLPDWDAERDLGYPGEFPFTRGVYPTMYRGRLWTMRQYAGFGSAAESNRRYRYLLAQGETGLSVAFDLPTQIGMDSDHTLALGEVGKVGVAIDSLEDMQALFDGIPLEGVSTSMTINSTAAILLALYVAVAKQQGANLQRLAGTVQNDILKEYIARGTYIYPLRPAMRIVTDIFAWCRDEVPNWNAISISGYHIREAGSTDVQEVAFTLANGIAYVEAAIAAGLAGGRVRAAAFLLLQLAQRTSDAGRQVPRRAPPVGAHDARTFRRARSAFADAALPRADRRLVAHRAAARKQSRARRAAVPRRGAGRRQSLHANALDEALALPTEQAALLALRTQQIIAQGNRRGEHGGSRRQAPTPSKS